MSAFNLGVNGDFLSSYPLNFCYSVHSCCYFQLSMLPISCNSISVRKSWNFDVKRPNFAEEVPILRAGKPNTPIGVSSLSIWTKKGWNFDGRKLKFGIVSAVGNGEGETHSSCSQLVENELKFSPTFNDYLKVMESVRTDRSKHLEEDDISPNLNKKPVGKATSFRAREKANSRREKLGYRETKRDSKNRKNVDVGRSGSRFRLVERALAKKITSANGGELKGARNYIAKNDTRDIMDGKHFMKEGKSSSKWNEQNVGEVRRVDESRISIQWKDASRSRGSDLFSDIKRASKKVNHVSGGEGISSRNEMKEKDNEQFNKSKVERRMAEFENNKSYPSNNILVKRSTERKLNEPLVPDSSYRNSSCIQTNTSKVVRKMIEFENEKSYPNNKALMKSSSERKLHDFSVPDSSYRKISSSQANMSKKSNDSVASKITKRDGPFSIAGREKIKDNLNVNEKDTLEMEIQREIRSQAHVRFQEDNRETEKHISRAIEVQGRSTKNKTQLDYVGGGKIDSSIDIEDRAAFKTFEVFTDVRNRPRVLRMELEERIQKLAKWLNATDVNMPAWQFSKMIHGANIKFTEHSILRVVQILGALGNWRRALQVVQWLHSRERFKAYKSRYIYTAVLDVLGKAKRPNEALNVFYAMRNDLSSYPDLAAYHCIAVTLGQAGLMKELFDVIDCMRAVPEKKFKLGPLQRWDPQLEPDLVVYHAVLNACVQQKQWEGAFWVLQQLKQQNLRPTNTTYGLIMEVMLSCGKYNLVHEFFKKVEKTSMPSTLNYKVLVNTLWREGKVDEAVLVVKDMERRGVVGSASLYYDLARCLCSAGRCEEALKQIDKICKVAKKPLVVTYTGLIQACLDCGSIENATYIFNEMHLFCSPNIVTYNIMLKSYVQNGMFVEAKDLFQKILDGSHHVRSRYDTDQKAFPDKFTFNTMIDACAATNNWDDFEYAYKQMLHHGFHFDTKRHLRLVLDAFRAGKRQVIETTWEHLIRFGRAPPHPIIQEQFCIKLEEDDYLAAISCVETHQLSGPHSFSEKAWLNLLNRNAHRFKNRTISTLIQELRSMIDERDSLRAVVYHDLLNACIKSAVRVDDSLTLTTV